MFKKLLVVLLALCMALTALPLSLSVAADEGDPTVTLICNGEVLDTVTYKAGDTSVEEPELPVIKGDGSNPVYNYMGAGMVLYEYVWPSYELTGESITVKARCRLVAYTANFYKSAADVENGTVYATRVYTVEDASYDIPSVPYLLDEEGKVVSDNGTWDIGSIDAANRVITVVAKYYTSDTDYAETHDEHTYYRTFRGIYACAECGELGQGKIHAVNGEDYYVYVKNGIPQHLGVIKESGGLRYINSRGRIAPTGSYDIGEAYTNGYIPAGTYEIDENGYIVVPETVKQGLVWDEDGEIRYYVDGVAIYAGVVLYEGNFYYINSARKAVKDQWYGITKTNGYFDVGEYWIDENGVIDLTKQPTDNTALMTSMSLRSVNGLYTVNGHVISVNIPQQ